MNRFASLSLLAAFGIGASSLCLNLAQAEPSTQPADATQPGDKKTERKIGRIIKPYGNLEDLTYDQKVKIVDIHDESVKAIKKIRDKEEEDILAVLTPEQKEKLKAMEEDASAKRKEKATKN